MKKRKLQVLTKSCPFIGMCQLCKKQFRSYRLRATDAKRIIKSKFDNHKCEENSASHSSE